MKTAEKNTNSKIYHGSACRNVFSTLAYFSIFRHPLNRAEIFENLHNVVLNNNQIDAALEKLLNQEFIEFSDGYYFLKSQNNIKKRIEGEIEAEKVTAKAKQKAALILKFPFVKSVFITGSLSKGFMDEKSDVDFFVITTPGRLWLCRTLLMLYKKLFLFNSHRYFCINYFVDSDNIEIRDRTIFTATELLFAIPVVNNQVSNYFFTRNNWAFEFYPNKEPGRNNWDLKVRQGFKRLLEKMLSPSFFNAIETACLKLTMFFWKKKFSGKGLSFDRELRSYKGVSKHHPNNYENKIVRMHNEIMTDFDNRFLHVILNFNGEENLQDELNFSAR